MRARCPDVEGFVERDGVKVGYEIFGAGEPAVVFSPPDALVHSRLWKAQVPYLARTSTVVTIDPRGNGRSGRPQAAAAYADTEFVADTIAVMDAAGIGQAVLIGLCTSSWRALLTAALHPDRVLGVVAIATVAPFLAAPLPARAVFGFDEVLDTDEGWAKDNRHYWLRDWRGYAEFFFGELLSEPHSTKQQEDGVGWAMEIGPETMLVHDEGPVSSSGRAETEALLRRVSCPVLAIHGQEDRCQPLERSERVAALTSGELLLLEGAGHVPPPGRSGARAAGTRAGGRQPGDPGVHQPVPPGPGCPPRLDPAAEPAETGALHVLADRPGPCPPRPGHRRRTAHPPAWPGGALAGPASRDRSASTSGTGWRSTAPAAAWTTTRRCRTCWPAPWRTKSRARSATARSSTTARRGPRLSWPSSSEAARRRPAGRTSVDAGPAGRQLTQGRPDVS